jgi:hypothetical protein
MSHRFTLAFAAAFAAALVVPAATSAHPPSAPRVSVLNTTALSGAGAGSTVGPDGAIYVPNSINGTVVRIDPNTGAERVIGTGLPLPNGGFGAWDVVFRGSTAYALVTLAGSDIGQDAVMGVYRLGKDGTFSVFADIGSWAIAHPPTDPDWFLPQGVQYSMEVWRDGFLVTDAHYAKVYRIDGRGTVSELVVFDSTDVVPLGLEVSKGNIYLSTAGPIPHLPSTAEINQIHRGGSVGVVGGWGPDYTGNRGLIVDVEAGRRGQLFGLLQGYWDLPPIDENEGFPAAPNTGEIVSVDADGFFHTVVGELNQPTSLEIVGHTAFVVTLSGTVLRIDGI